MESKTFLFFLILFVYSTYFTASATKYEHISFCRFFERHEYRYGTINVTFICGETDKENEIFGNDETFHCIDDEDRGSLYFHDVVVINFENCRFPEMSRNFFQKLPYPTIFNISNMELETIQAEKFEGAKTNLTHFIASHNRLTEWPVKLFVNYNQQLKYIDFSCNSIGNLNADTLAHLTNLEYLDLRRTNLSKIALKTFSFQHKLMYLDLSENNLKILDFDMFLPNLRFLQSLRLNGNQLTELNGFDNRLFPQLTLLDIKNNRFSCSYLKQFMKTINWEKIEIALDPNSIDLQKPYIRGVDCYEDQ